MALANGLQGRSQLSSLSRTRLHRGVVRMSATPAPKTGHHTTPEELRIEALSKFFTKDVMNIKCTPTSGGVNNVVQYVDTSDGQRYILRVYNNGGSSEKVEYEHLVLSELQKQQHRLSFKVPKAVPSVNGKTHERLSNGAECCIFEIIPGTLAKTTSPQEVGRATGELSAAMAPIKVDMVAPTARYTDVFRAHHAMNRDLFYSEVANNPGFNVCREAIDYLTEEIRAIEVKLKKFDQMNLPMSMIHGDLHYDNVMVVGDQVSGLLDFEFCLYDWRAMELAVALSKYVGEDQPLPLCEEFITGFVQHGQLTDQEIDIIPDLINLRIFSNVVYFTGRAWTKEDGLDALTTRAGTYAKRVKWVNANAAAISAAIKTRMRALAPAAMA